MDGLGVRMLELIEEYRVEQEWLRSGEPVEPARSIEEIGRDVEDVVRKIVG